MSQKWQNILYRSCVFEQKILVTSFFSRTALRNKFLCTEHSRVSCICEVDDDGDVPSELIRSLVLGENPPFFTAGILCFRGSVNIQ